MIYLATINLEELFRKKMADNSINNIIISQAKYSKELIDPRQIFSTYSSENFNPTPACLCGDEKAYWKDGNVTCNVCGWRVSPVWSESQSDSSNIWVGTTEHIPRIMNMKVIATIKEFFQSGKGFCPISWFVDSGYKPSKETSVLQDLKSSGFARGYNNWCDNYIKITKYLQTLKYYKERCKDSYGLKGLNEFLITSKSTAFTSHHPLPKRGMIIIEKTPTGTYKDKIGISALNSIRKLTGLETYSKRKQINRMGSVTMSLIRHHNDFLSQNLFNGKMGMVRKTIFGTRTHFSSRCLITGVTGVHDMNEVVLSWSSAISMMQPHLINKLVKRGNSVLQAKLILNRAFKVFSQEVSDCMDDLLSETRSGKLTITLQRNPSMGPMSMQLSDATIDRDPENKTNRISILIVKFFNADFDGDYNNVMLMLDIRMEELMQPLRAYNNLFDLIEPGRVSGFLHLTSPLLATASRWLDEGNKNGDSSFMDSLS